jgi:hypothetical protein
MFVLLGVIGWNEYAETSKFWLNHNRLLKSFYTFFWVVNIIMLLLLSTTYSKRSRVEAMYYFYNKNVSTLLLEDSNRYDVTTLPNYYSGKWLQMYKLPKPEKDDSSMYFSYRLYSRYVKILHSLEFFNLNPTEPKPEYILFFDNKNLETRKQNLIRFFPNMKLEMVILPSLMDRVINRLNPKNRNETIYIFKTN